MNPAELIARLEGRVTVLESLGGEPEIETQDISFALAKIHDPIALDLIRIKYGLNDCDKTRLLGRFYFATNTLAEERHWQLKDDGTLVHLCKEVLNDYLNSHVCDVCSGRKHAMIGSKLVVCPNCGGVGIKFPTDKNRAKRIGIGVRQYQRIWGSRFAQLMADLAGREITALSTMAQALE